MSGNAGTRVPPHNLEAERSILGAVLIKNDSLDAVREVGLDPTDFYVDAHAKIYDVLISVSDRRLPIDMVTVSSALKDRGWYDAVGGLNVLTSLFDDAFAAGNVAYYARIVKDKSIQRQIIGVCSDVMATAFSGVEDTESFINDTETQIFGVGDARVENPLVELKNVLLQNMHEIEENTLRGKEVTGIATGFHEFDHLTTGLHSGQVMVLAARPGMGKTSWFISALKHATVGEGAVVALFSLEMSKEELGFRFLSGLSRIESRKIKTGKIYGNEFHRLTEAADKLSRSKIYIDDSGGLTVMDVRARCRRLKLREKRLDLVVIDYLQLMRGSKASRGEGSREREISEISRNLKELSKEIKVPIIALSQLSRAVESRQDKRPMLADLRESGAIEQDADLVVFIYRDDYYDKDSDNRGVAELIIAKNRSGETGSVRLAWLGQYTSFENLSGDHSGQAYSPGQTRGPRRTDPDINL